jgi:hypothetical protein
MEEGSKQCVLVLGMHRSGTSAIAGSLGFLGYETSKNLMAPTKYNAKGYFENMSIFALNERILEAGGARWDLVEDFSIDNIPNQEKVAFISSIQQIVID